MIVAAVASFVCFLILLFIAKGVSSVGAYYQVNYQMKKADKYYIAGGTLAIVSLIFLLITFVLVVSIGLGAVI